MRRGAELREECALRVKGLLRLAHHRELRARGAVEEEAVHAHDAGAVVQAHREADVTCEPGKCSANQTRSLTRLMIEVA